MPTNNESVKMEYRSRSGFDSISKDDNTIYVVEETDGTRQLYLGSKILNGGLIDKRVSGDLSSELYQATSMVSSVTVPNGNDYKLFAIQFYVEWYDGYIERTYIIPVGKTTGTIIYDSQQQASCGLNAYIYRSGTNTKFNLYSTLMPWNMTYGYSNNILSVSVYGVA